MEIASLSFMNFLMLEKIGFSCKRFPAFRTGEWLLPRVSSPMFNQSQFLGKTFATFLTGKQILSCVNSLMLDQIGFVLKASTTFLTRKLPLRMSLQMREEIRFPGETFRTFRTRKRSLVSSAHGMVRFALHIFPAFSKYLTPSWTLLNSV